MLGTIINTVLVIIGSLLGILFKNKISEKYTATIMKALALCTVVIGITSAIETQNILYVIVSLVIGTLVGELLRIEDRLDSLGEVLSKRFKAQKGGGKFTEGFVAASLLFCVGSMAIMGSMEAGINGDYSILLSKSLMDFVAALSFAAVMGIGVMLSAVSVLVYQGGITLLAMLVGPMLEPAVVTEMSAVGGVILIGLALNMMAINGFKIKVGNMLPGIFLPIVLIPMVGKVGTLF